MTKTISASICLLDKLLLLFVFAASNASAELPTEDPPQGELHPLLAETIKTGPYEAQWESLVTHPIPDWFQMDKIGLSAHWGPYAVPGWTPRKDTPYGLAYAEWYMNWLQRGKKPVKEYHQKTYNSVPYDEFIDGTPNVVTGQIDGFFAKDFDANRWMMKFEQAGVKYFFITSKHHDGFCLWDTKYTDRNAKQMGPKRDLLRELVDAARAHGIKIGFYYSFYEWYNPIYRGKKDLSGYKGIKRLCDEDGDGNSNEYVDDFMIPQIKELIDQFHPDYLCFDGEWDHGYTYWRGRQILAYYYNQAARRGQEVLINDRFGYAKDGVSRTRGVYGDFYHVEYSANVDRNKPWAMWRGFGNSYGYNRNEHPSNILSIKDTLRMIVDVVSDNGNIEFNLGPKADGTLADFEVERLEAMGQWMSANGEAIYGTQKSPVGIPSEGRVTHQPESNTLYFHVYDWPTDGVIQLRGVHNNITAAKLLASDASLRVSKPAADIVEIEIPKQAPDSHISVIALEYQGTLKAEEYLPTIYADDHNAFHLTYANATVRGRSLKVEHDKKALGYWSNETDYPEWKIAVENPGQRQVALTLACTDSAAGSKFILLVDGEKRASGTIPATGSWTNFKNLPLGKIWLTTGTHKIQVRCRDIKEAGMNLRRLHLRDPS